MASRNSKKRDHHGKNEERRFTVRGIRRDPVDISKLSKALIGLVMADAERQAQAEQEARDTTPEVASGDNPQTGGDSHVT